MQTSAIRYRVADFLKQHPPFLSMEEADLLELVAHGRVKFHESEEFLCWQNSNYSPLMFVIQQGSVSLWEEVNGAEILRDIRGPGDIIGIERFLGSLKYPYSAKSNTEVMVYALLAADFEPLLAKYPQAKRYVEAYGAAGAVYRDVVREGVHRMYVAELARQPLPVTCSPDSTVQQAAQIMLATHSAAIAVMRDRELLGVLSAGDLVRWVASGEIAQESSSVKDVMSPPPPAVAPQTLVSDCVLTMSAANASVVALTADGTVHGGLLRLVTATDLQPAFGDHPVHILREISQATELEALRVLHLRARAFLLAQLSDPSCVDWLAALADRVNIAIVRRLTELAGNDAEDWTWCFFGAAGRRELLASVEPEIALVCGESANISQAQQALARLRMELAECGYVPRAPLEASEEILCANAATWHERFAEWIRNPILSQMYQARPLFDLRCVAGPLVSWQSLDTMTREVIRAQPSFEQILANDCLSTFPPLTFVADEVVEESGERSEMFAMQDRGLSPIVEVGRVFAIASGRALGLSTLEKLELARSRRPVSELVFRDAMETLRVMLYLQARTGLRLHTSGAEILPAQFSRMDRQALKSGFRSIHNLLEFTVKQLWTEAP